MTDLPVDRNRESNVLSDDQAKVVDAGLSRVADRLARSLTRDAAVQTALAQLRTKLAVDRLALYYFYRHWKGQVTCEALSHEKFSILGSTGADDCFNHEYAALYLQGRIRAIPDVETEPLQDCHRAFLQTIQVKANLVVPILTGKGLWGLLVAHHCHAPRSWQESDIEAMRSASTMLAQVPAIAEN